MMWQSRVMIEFSRLLGLPGAYPTPIRRNHSAARNQRPQHQGERGAIAHARLPPRIDPSQPSDVEAEHHKITEAKVACLHGAIDRPKDAQKDGAAQ